MSEKKDTEVRNVRVEVGAHRKLKIRAAMEGKNLSETIESLVDQTPYRESKTN